MKLNHARKSRLTGAFILAAFVISLVAVRGTQANNEPAHLTTDWSHRHVIYTPPHTLVQQFRLSANPRYVQQVLRRNAQKNGGPTTAPSNLRWRRAPEPVAQPLHRDWSMYLGYNGNPSAIAPATVGSGNFPAKFSFDPTQANCEVPAPPAGQQPDFVVYNTSLPGSTANVAFIDSGTITAQPNQYDQFIIQDDFGLGVTLTMIASNVDSNTQPGSNGSPFVSGVGTFDATDTSLDNIAAHLANAINLPGNGSTFSGFGTTLTAVAVGNVVNLTFATQAGFTSFATYPGYMSVTGPPAGITWTFGKLVDGAAGTPSVVAIDNLYAGTCSSNIDPVYFGSTPLFYWAYNTGGQVVTSPILSADGSQVAYVQNSGGAASLVILKWRANSRTAIDQNTGNHDLAYGTPQNPVTLTSQASGAAYRSCDPTPDPGGCMLTIPLSGGATDTKSSPFLDYVGDVLYVGDDQGNLHKFTGVFKGTPAEVISGGANVWPAVIDSGAILNSPVFNDSDGGITASTPGVYVTDNQGVLWRVDATAGSGAGSKFRTAKLADTGFDDAPLLDPTTGQVYVFARGDEQGGNGGGAATRSGVFQFPVRFAANAAGSEAVVSSSFTLQPTAFYVGTFDDIYFSSSNGTGSMYVCSTNGGHTAMWRIPVTAGILGSPVPGPTLSTGNVDCSPVTEFKNGSTDRIFVSITGSPVTGAPVHCPAGDGCVMSFDVTTSTGWNVNTPTAATEQEPGGTSGIVVDNSSGAAGASQIYFVPLGVGNCNTGAFPTVISGTGGCSIQTTQNGLN